MTGFGVVVVEDTLWLESECSELPSRGVIYPPPSTAMGIMNSRGLFLIGCDLAILCVIDWETFVVFPVVVESDSESLVDWHDNDSDLKIIESYKNYFKILKYKIFIFL